MPDTGFLIIRAVVSSEEREQFDHWYETDHLKSAMQTMGAEAAWRFWSETDLNVHYAMYQFSDILKPKTIKSQADSGGGATLRWPNVKITREVWRQASQ